MKALRAASLHANADIAVGSAIPVLAVVVFWGARRARQHIVSAESLID